MDGTTLVDTLTDDLETELSRLGSSKWLYALTDGDMTGEAVRAAAAADAAAAAETFAAWTDGDDDAAAALFEALADEAAGRRDAVADATVDPADRRTYDALVDLADPVERAGGALGYSLVLDRTVGQMVGFFVGDADPSTADQFRGLRDGVGDARDRILDTLDAVCDGDDDWDRAADAAAAVVEATYDDYVETLESMGVKPKNVC